MLKKALISLLLFIPSIVLAYSDYVYVGGENIGIELKADGVLIVGFYKVNDIYIANEAGLQIGDRITFINDEKVTSIYDLTNKIKASNGNINITYVRDNQIKTAALNLPKENDTYKTGIYVKDSITGIGTLTYIDPNTKLFGALGHEIIDSRTGEILSISGGSIYDSKVTDIEPSSNGVPGEKNAQINTESINGTIFENTIKGIFGNYTNDFDDSKLYKVAKPDEIKTGKATILTVLEDDVVKEYEIEITKISKNQDTKNLSFKITDSELLQKTNGIVQGMSGSPIIQDDYIIGAVTHVVVDNPHKGYGIFITSMLEEGEN